MAGEGGDVGRGDSDAAKVNTFQQLSAVNVRMLQISKLLGARVVAVTRGQDKAAYLQRLGADAVIDTAAPAAAGQRLHKLAAAAAPKGEVVCRSVLAVVRVVCMHAYMHVEAVAHSMAGVSSIAGACEVAFVCCSER